jgi:hypothetical protein
MYGSTPSLTTALDMSRCQRHTHAALPPGKRPGTHCTGSWVGPRIGLDGCRKSGPPPQGSDPRTVQPVASRYTDYAVAAQFCNRTSGGKKQNTARQFANDEYCEEIEMQCSDRLGSRHSSVGIVTTLQVEQPKNRGSIPARIRDYPRRPCPWRL